MNNKKYIHFLFSFLLLVVAQQGITQKGMLVNSDNLRDNHVNLLEQNKPVNFLKIFPDTTLAELVASRLNKTLADSVTIKEIGNITGEFNCGAFEELSNLTGIGYLTGITAFNCSKNSVTELPAEIGNLTNLESLDLGKAFSLNKIPPEIGKLKRLRYIRICLTELKELPAEIGDLTNLDTLWIFSNQLKTIPKEIGNLKHLVSLDIHSNNIGSLPDEICNLTSLVSLNASHCGLKTLPKNIGNLSKLHSLNLFNNDLEYLPTSISKLNNLSKLNVLNNYKLSESYKKDLPIVLKEKNSKK
ncbi:hypothetical protein A9P82_00770 [Arachidicoccus ginsenosidimutans]|uniref:leucine-rich repeat domain-containing protein n=1 Tax=Arachidicoccus sp. BS20 TaxID=1850526 RepID=UPI0007F157D9|nr:leucine-rich repeat domain-containing protein [Arachidicoccus sp. BS20]ANI87976.1 hypothetical protein A9P82_00770 [Arachidicoccus sp. BS20]